VTCPTTAELLVNCPRERYVKTGTKESRNALEKVPATKIRHVTANAFQQCTGFTDGRG
jgi:hypothetical protein